MKKIIIMFLFTAIFIVSSIGLSSCNSSNITQDDSESNEELIDSIVRLSLDEVDGN